MGIGKKIIVGIFIFFSSISFAGNKSSGDFEKIFADWTVAFNHKDLTGACGLFSKSVVADYQGVKQKDYQAICGGFKKIFDESNKQYFYGYKIHQVYQSGDLAVVRVTWYLSVYNGSILLEKVRDEGIDVLMKKNNTWQIVNYVAYPAKM